MSNKSGKSFYLKSVKDLARYSVLKVRGVKHTNNITSGFTDVYDDTQSMFRALNIGRNSVVITHTADGLFAIKKFNLEGISLIDRSLASLRY